MKNDRFSSFFFATLPNCILPIAYRDEEANAGVQVQVLKAFVAPHKHASATCCKHASSFPIFCSLIVAFPKTVLYVIAFKLTWYLYAKAALHHLSPSLAPSQHLPRSANKTTCQTLQASPVLGQRLFYPTISFHLKSPDLRLRDHALHPRMKVLRSWVQRRPSSPLPCQAQTCCRGTRQPRTSALAKRNGNPR